MNPLLAAELHLKRVAIAELCSRYGVALLELFGSGTTDRWNAAESDVDFVVTFRQEHGMGLADRYLGLAEALEALLARRVDLITPASIRNPYFRDEVNASRTRVYAEQV